MSNINLRESISEISKAWNYDITDRTIHNTFSKAGFFVYSESSESTEDKDDIPLEEMKKKIWIQLKEKQDIMDSMLLDDFLFLNSEAETSGSLTESDILNSVINKNSTAMKTKMKMKTMTMQKSISLRMMK
ncbi:uncharacterized protein NPIL_343141 [Nephila pilipes]|uniref:Uncharacterized protein n=1 Tax=Nephila pilipes TaxID=299642 RepID=A0A8X6NKV8_NEPPI|nr:uncharacterized protein NPIL_343141 [Nephila pilipes]